jgi:Na+:H+ antiporter, NhaA family
MFSKMVKQSHVLLLCAAILGAICHHYDWYASADQTLHPVIEGVIAVFFWMMTHDIRQTLSWPTVKIVGWGTLGGMLAPMVMYTAINPHYLAGMCIASATDIAFALGLLPFALPNASVQLRSFLFQLAILDDLGALMLLLVFYTPLSWPMGGMLMLMLSVSTVALYYSKTSDHPLSWLTGALLAYGIHCLHLPVTLAGIWMGLWVTISPFHQRILHSVMMLIGLPLFAFMSVHLPSFQTVDQRTVWAITLGLWLGKPLGVVLGSRLFNRDHMALSCLCGVGFTMGLIMAKAAFAHDIIRYHSAVLGIGMGSLLSWLSAMLIKAL